MTLQPPPPPDVDARLAEVTKQARHVTEYRATRLDHAFFRRRMNHQKLTPWVDPVLELPLSGLGAMMREHVDCRDAYQRGLFCLRESSLPLLTPARVFSSVNTSGSPFASADQCPQALLYRLRGGGVQGVHQQLLLARAGIPSLSNHAVQMGIDKGKGDGHLYASYRPVPLTSPIPRSESRVA